MTTTAVAERPANQNASLEAALVQGDLSQLSVEQRLSYYRQVCDSLGLNPLTSPFAYITLNSKLQLYAKKDCTDQLRKLHGVDILDLAESEREGVFIVTAKARDRNGRTDMAKGAVNVAGLKGDVLANALMKAETKAKRRVTLSICGLGMLDETELETISGPAAEPECRPQQPGQEKAAKGEKHVPLNGPATLEKLQKTETTLVALGKELELPLCAGNELVSEVRLKLEQQGRKGDEKEWSPEDCVFARKVATEFKERKKAGIILDLLKEVGWPPKWTKSAAEALGCPDVSDPGKLDEAQFRQAVRKLREQIDLDAKTQAKK